MLTLRYAAAALLVACSTPCLGLHVPSSGSLAKAPASTQSVRGVESILKSSSLFEAKAMNLRGGAPKAAVQEAAKPWYASFWNESVELSVLFGLWYWGNVYCKCKSCPIDLGLQKMFLVYFSASYHDQIQLIHTHS
jgi:hypothetical protein